MPSAFIGKNELITNAKDILNGTTNASAGQKINFANPGATINVNDVVKVQVLALNPNIKGRRHLSMMPGGVAGNKWTDSLANVNKRFSEAVKDGRLSADGTQPTSKLLFGSNETDRVLGIKFRSYEEQVVSVTGHDLERLEKARRKVDVLTNGH